jgi:DNA-binding beta-propeller fold protein YncE
MVKLTRVLVGASILVVLPVLVGLQSAASAGVPDPISGSQVAVDTATNTVYAVDGGSVSVTNEATCNAETQSDCTPVATSTLPSASDSEGIAVDATTNTVYVTNSALGTVTVINGASCDASTTTGCAPVANTIVGTTPIGVAVDATTDTIYVANFGSHDVSVIEGSTCDGTTVSGCTTSWATAPVGAAPIRLDVNATTNTVYVANNDSSDVSVSAVRAATRPTPRVAALRGRLHRLEAGQPRSA